MKVAAGSAAPADEDADSPRSAEAARATWAEESGPTAAALPRRCCCRIRYRVLAGTLFVLCVALSVLERWLPSGPLWPGCTPYHTACVADAVRPDARVFDTVARASGRVILVSVSALFLTQCDCSMNALAEHAPIVHVMNVDGTKDWEEKRGNRPCLESSMKAGSARGQQSPRRKKPFLTAATCPFPLL